LRYRAKHGVDPGGLKYVGGVRVCDVLSFKTVNLLDNSECFTSSRKKDFCQKWKVKLIFEVLETV